MKIVDTMPLEFFGEVSIYFGVGVEVVMALLLGGLIGYDREKKFKSAGIKTNILICIGATLYTTIGMMVSAGTSGVADPNRMAAQIVSGIGFLGAGAIIQGRGNVMGMTTAAMIWVVAAVGFAVGAGYPFTAALFTLTVLVVMKLISPVYRYLEQHSEYEYYQLQVLSRGSVKRTIRGIINNFNLDIDEMFEEQFNGKKGRRILNLYMLAHRRHMERVVMEIRSALNVDKAVYFTVAEMDAEEEARANKESSKASTVKKEIS
ncbi:MAG: MgtC/SapB family protein [Bdellovibrionales bacterium]|nr:MgtC/SapB family protein [Bdellovibrionales bacterium]